MIKRRFVPGTVLIVLAGVLWELPSWLIPNYRTTVASAPVAGARESRQFTVDVTGLYVVQSALPKASTPMEIRVEAMEAKPGDPNFMDLSWTISSRGRVVGRGGSREHSSSYGGAYAVGQGIGAFRAVRGNWYVLDVENGPISKALLNAKPLVQVRMDGQMNKTFFVEAWICQVVALGLGLCGAVWVGVEAIRQRTKGQALTS